MMPADHMVSAVLTDRMDPVLAVFNSDTASADCRDRICGDLPAAGGQRYDGLCHDQGKSHAEHEARCDRRGGWRGADGSAAAAPLPDPRGVCEWIGKGVRLNR